MSFVCSTGGGKSTILRRDLPKSERVRPQPSIIQIPLDFIDNLENSNSVPYAIVSGENITGCFLEKRKLKIKPLPAYTRGIITYGLLTLGETINTGSVISEMEREGEFLVHTLKEDAVMLGTIYLH